MLSPTKFVTELKKLNPQPLDTSDETEIVRALTQFYCTFLCQDWQDGTAFDNMVLDTLKLLHPKEEHR